MQMRSLVGRCRRSAAIVWSTARRAPAAMPVHQLQARGAWPLVEPFKQQTDMSTHDCIVRCVAVSFMHRVRCWVSADLRCHRGSDVLRRQLLLHNTQDMCVKRFLVVHRDGLTVNLCLLPRPVNRTCCGCFLVRLLSYDTACACRKRFLRRSTHICQGIDTSSPVVADSQPACFVTAHKHTLSSYLSRPCTFASDLDSEAPTRAAAGDVLSILLKQGR